MRHAKVDGEIETMTMTWQDATHDDWRDRRYLAPWMPEDDTNDATPVADTPTVRIVPPFTRDRRVQVSPDAIRLVASTGLGCVFTVELRDGDHHTYRIVRATKSSAFPGQPPPLFASILTGPHNDDPWAYTYVGLITEPDLSLRLTTKSTIRDHRFAYLTAALVGIASGTISDPIVAIDNAGWCSRCGRTLTTPDSLRAGIGPDCLAKGLGA